MTTPSKPLHPSSARDGSPDDNALPRAAAAPNGDAPNAPRRSSFNFLRRKSSSETRNNRTASGAKMSKKQKALAQEEALRRQREAAMRQPPPRLPNHSPLPQIAHFGGDDARPDSIAIVSNKADSYYNNNTNFSRPSLDHHRIAPSGPPVDMPVPPMPAVGPSYMDYDPYPRTESMTHRGRYSYASSAISNVGVNSPRRVRRRKDPTPFNVLVLGGKSAGKTCFIDFLRTALALPAKKRPHTPSSPRSTLAPGSPFTSHYLETEVDGERVGLTLWDSEGLERNIVDYQLTLVTAFLESKFEDTFSEEQKVVRSPGAKDTHIHCVFLIMDPARLDANIADPKRQTSSVVGGLDEALDINVLRELQGRTTVIPVISKADTITTAHMRHLKRLVWDTLKRAKLDPLEALSLDESEEEDGFDEREEDALVRSDADSEVLNNLRDKSSSSENESLASSHRSGSQSPPTSPPTTKKHNHARKASAMSASIDKENVDGPFLPLSIISPDPYEPEIVGRKFPWGFADPYNDEHCDFVRLRESVFSEWRAELREASRERWYESWRTQRLQKVPVGRRVTTSDGLASKQLSVPAQNGRAASAGREVRQHRSVPY